MPRDISPTPWSVQHLSGYHNGYSDWQTYAVRDARNCCLALVGTMDRLPSPENPGNAQLMAAAPQLRSALAASRAWVALYLTFPGHEAAAASMLSIIDAALVVSGVER